MRFITEITNVHKAYIDPNAVLKSYAQRGSGSDSQ